MGLSVAISGGIVMFTLVYVMLMIPGIADKTVLITKASSDISEVENSMLKTNIQVDSISAATGSSVINFTVNNSGTEKLWNFEKFSLLVTYSSASGTKTELLAFAGDCSGNPTSGNWCVDSISDDGLDPDILNTGELLNARSRVSTSVAAGTVTTVVSTNNGIVATNSTST
ncbi:MAG: hypothetical protein LV468_01610 [Candidatus Nitrosotenuis sp.]|uniref:hypothetical protein n=1 Tax=Candidatus Nitrosotenuis cloacae TaxID=1603555 RepID=UPI002280836C|nr:hypothetical protein [Candidatus Nitrosotenuis cloacae]MDC8437679.1 hypothetical protein [Candidatus Nitrosotenuis sp.]